MAGRIAGIATLLTLLVGGSAHAEKALTVSASLSERRVLVGDVVNLRIRAVARVNGNISVTVPRVKGLAELSRSSSEGTSVSWSSDSGQQVTREQTLVVQLQANTAGTIQIPAVSAKVGRLSATSQALVLVVQGQEAIAAQATHAQAGQVVPPQADEMNLFTRYRLNKGSAHLGEQVLLDLEIFATPNRNFSLDEVPPMPELDEFWTEAVFKPERLTKTTEVVAGRRYDVYRLWRVALFGLSAGEHTLPPIALSFSSGRSLFRNGQRMKVRTTPVTLTVSPLPSEGRPKGFSSTNVGQYRLQTTVDARTLPAGKALVLKVILSGMGNIENAKLPALSKLPGFRAFPPNVTTDTQNSLNGLQGTKTAEILLMPTQGGRLQIPSLTLPVFDPGRGDYQRLSTPSIPILVQGTPERVATVSAAQPEPEVQPLKLRPVHVRADILAWTAPPYRDRLFWAGLAGPPLLFMLLLLFERVWARTQHITPAHERKAVARDAKVRLQEARDKASAGNMAEAYAAFVDALFTLGSQRMQVSLQGLTTEQVCEEFANHGVTEAVVAQLEKELKTADYARFASGALENLDTEAVLSNWETLLAAVEDLATKETQS